MKKAFQYSTDGRYVNSYKSVSKAAEVMNVDESTIRRAITHKRKAAGFYWKNHKDRYAEESILQEEPPRPTPESMSSGFVKGEGVITSENGNILVIGDTHLPFAHKDYLEHCKRTYRKFNCTTVVHIGDVIDNHALSFHDSDPDGFGGGKELALAKKELKKWYEAFPSVYVCLGNHDNLSYRKAFKHGISINWIKDHSEVLNSPKGWKFAERWVIDDVIFEHGVGSSGDMGATNRAKENRQSTVIGHSHSFAGVRYLSSRTDVIFGMNVGCGIDADEYAFAYAKYQAKRPTLACGVVYDNGKQATVVTLSDY